MNESIRLYDDQGNRLYLTSEERTAFLNAARKAPRQVRTFCAVLHFTGCRLSEALALTPRRIDLADGTVRFETLKTKPFRTSRKSRASIHKPLDFLRTFRNRIAHHEPIFNRHIEADY